MSKWLPANEAELYLRNKLLNDKYHITIGPAQAYIEAPFNMASYTAAGNFDLVQDSTTGTIYAVSTQIYQDNGNPI